ncbi:MAG: two pore domain potassium channel family protein [Bacteroidetes bacterium]|nr:MAG: two pore domain potassium channel family protein [Bacteroidota bacterium]
MGLLQIAKTIQNIASSIWSDRIMNAVFKGVAIYISLSFVFGLFYYFFDSLDFKSTAGSDTVHFLDYIYFSAVTFTTIGYGDIVPKAGAGQIIVLIESCFELTFFPVFGGFIAYKFLQRPNDILLTDNFFIRYRNERIYLSSRVGNKGKNLIDCTATFEFIQLADNVKRTLYRREINAPLVEMTWYLEIRLDGDENTPALQQLKTLIANPHTSIIRTTVSGYDSNSGNMVHVFKYYTMDKLIYGGKFLDVYTWEGVKRTKPDWTHFNKVVHLTPNEQQLIDELLK